MSMNVTAVTQSSCSEWASFLSEELELSVGGTCLCWAQEHAGHKKPLKKIQSGGAEFRG